MSLERLIQILAEECGEKAPAHMSQNDMRRLFRALVNVRPPMPASEEFLRLQDEYLQQELRLKGTTDIAELTPVLPDIYLWQGDITTLKCDAIVNAANSKMLGCFCPNHGCIDNAIHTFAGVQLRLECYEAMKKQGHDEPTGSAKLTSAYNLPCKYVLHTVGPIVDGKLAVEHEKALESCYRSCLELAQASGIKSVAFCCISTGEFRFPNRRAAEIAIGAALKFKKDVKVIFNVFKDIDYEIYRELLEGVKRTQTRA